MFYPRIKFKTYHNLHLTSSFWKYFLCKVGSNAIAGKEKIVLSGLAATRDNIDEFLSYFESSDVQIVQNRIRTENELNVKEYDANLGTILNLK